jgi:DNA-binding NtrC family response regulator/pSer/pThr/pTyr-binding forkhead associated (FHA) protein
MTALLLLTGPQAGRRHELTGEVIIGRSPSCTIALEDAKVSRRHVRLVLEDGEARAMDLGSRNGTLVNGEKLEGEVVLLPGDRLQVGDSTVLFEPTARASLSDRDAEGEVASSPVEELIPAVGAVAGLYHAGVALISATSEAMVLRRAAEELARGVNAEKAAALLGGTEGLLTAAVVGAEAVEVPRSLVRGALERKEAGRARGVLCAPLIASGGAPFGILFAERPEGFTVEEQRTIAALGRLAGEAITSVRGRGDGAAAPAVLIGSSRQFRKTVEAARRAATGTDTVVIHGEAGSGRSAMARYIHSRSSRALGPLVEVDCRQPATAVEDLLFGRTSAPGVPPRPSVLLQADGGVALLRHVDALPRHLSERLARLLARRVAPGRQGGEEAVDLRVMATGPSAVDAMTARGELDPELGRALAGQQVEALPLRERRSDVLQLFDFFAGQVAQGRRKEAPTLSPDARRLLVDYHWPGNVEELRQVSARLALLYAGHEVPALRLPAEIQDGPQAPEASRTLAQRISRLERDAISEALREANGKKIRAAALLGISRPTLDKKIEEYQLVVEKRRA